MLRVTCDFCGKELRRPDDRHFVVKIEAYPAHDPAELTEEDLDEDHMEAVGNLLCDMEESLTEPEVADPNKHFRFDLCADCHKRFVRDPLGKEPAQKFDFSNN
jgi:hypothetical protein